MGEKTLGPYEILHELGRGPTGALYAARDRSTGASVALKSVAPTLLKQARSARRLRHRNIVEILDVGEADGTGYVAMERLEGESLRKMLDDGPLPIARAIRIAHGIACGLAYAHLEGVAHHGVRPSNVIVLHSGVVKITDFGIAQLGEAALISGHRAGCLSYLSPEQLRGDPVDHRCDLFSLGALFYEMLTHRRPFEGDSPKQILENILRAEPPRPSELNPHVPRALDAIVFGMLARNPHDRLPGAPVLLRELQRLEEGLGLQTEPVKPQPAPEPELRASAAEALPYRNRIPEGDFDYQQAILRMGRKSPPQPWSGSRRAILAALALLLAVPAIVVMFLYYPLGRGEPPIAASPVQSAPPTTPQASSPPAPQPLAAEPIRSAEDESLVARAPEQPAVAEAAQMPEQEEPEQQPEQDLPPHTQPTASVPDEQPGGTAQLVLAVAPQGEIYIDGEHLGTTPPMTTFDLEPGMHRIEVRSGSRKPYLTYMTVQPGEVRRIRHDFNAKPSRPPA